MVQDLEPPVMARALLTDTERERLSGESDDEKQRIYESKSRVKRRINEQLPHDVEILTKQHPDLLEELRKVVCDTGTRNVHGVELKIEEQLTVVGPTPVATQGETIEITAFRPGIGDENGGVLFEKRDVEKGENWAPVGYAPIEEFAEAVKDGRIRRGEFE